MLCCETVLFKINYCKRARQHQVALVYIIFLQWRIWVGVGVGALGHAPLNQCFDFLRM